MSFPTHVRLVGAVLAVTAVATACRLPDLREEQRKAPPLAQTSFVYDAEGRLITTLHAEEDRVLIAPRRIPRALKDAVVAIEDRRFWEHEGVDLKALVRAAYRNATEGEIVEGGSTITQQYVKNTMVGREQTIDRKIREAALAYQLEQKLSKEQILGRYLNTVYFGRGAYGIRQAAKKFFSKRVPDLNLAEGALLAGLIASPSELDPLENPNKALARRNVVLARMAEEGMIPARRYEHARTRPLALRLPREEEDYPAAHFLEYLKARILTDRRFGQTYTQRYNFLFSGGLRIHTTIDLDMQRAAEQAVRGILSAPGDPYGALTAIDPRTGEIKAMVGGRDFFAPQRRDPYAKVNLATGGSTGRQAGSAFKPFALVAALQDGISPAHTYQGGTSIALDDPVCRNGPGDPWQVQNYEGSSYGNVTVEQATVSSVNVVYAQIIRDVGPRQVVEAARRMGIRSRLRAYCSSVLGSNEVNTLEMASAYGTLATNGLHVAPVAIERIENASGEVIFRPRPRGEQVLDPAVAWTATQILRKVILYGTGVAANIGRPAAGKTGTAQEWRDAWFVGFVPQLSAAVWVGFPQGQVSMVPPTTRLRVTGGSFPAQIWHAFMTAVTANMPVKDFPQPEAEFVTLAVDITRGCIANESTPQENIRTMRFLEGTEPTRACLDPLEAERTGVPSVVGMPVDDATGLLEDAGFAAATTARYSPGHPPGTVLEQDPEAGATLEQGSTVSLVVTTSDPPLATVPSVLGMASGAARSELEGQGFSVALLDGARHDPQHRAGQVLSQTPAGGTQRPLGSTVSITLNPPEGG